MTSPGIQYFIVTETPDSLRHCDAGCICYTYERQRSFGFAEKLQVFVLGSFFPPYIEIDKRRLEELSAAEAALLLALADDSERLRWFRDGDVLRQALTLCEGTEVVVEEGRETLNGVLRYIGKLSKAAAQEPLTAVFFGVELQGEDKGKGNTDGRYDNVTLFTCDRDCGIFAPFSRVRPRHSESFPSADAESPSGWETAMPVPGDRVTYFIEDYCCYGMVLNVREKDGQRFVLISTDIDATGKTGEVEVPLQFVVVGEYPADSDLIALDNRAAETESAMGLNSLVEVSLGTRRLYGIIRWIGTLPGQKEIMAGLELEEDVGVSDGTFKNVSFFQCPPRRALFVKKSACRPDARFLNDRDDDAAPKRKVTDGASRDSQSRLEPVAPIGADQVDQILVGRMKGIQGHCNSCYMDAALFSLFSCSSVLDSMLFKSTEPQDAPIQRTLLNDIVNPLRSEGFVQGRHIMKLRQQLEKHGYCHSFTTEEKDPEEFLTIVMHHILALDPLLKLWVGGKVQESFCYQIFLEQNHNLVLPTVQQLLEHSFHNAALKLAEVPSCLILQMPRFGKKFKMFDKIIPSLELDITRLLSQGPQQCILCGKLAQEECLDCFEEPVFSQTGCKVFCELCSVQVHSHPQRRSHQAAPLDIPEGYVARGVPRTLTRDIMELFAVLCIETSHYVSFIKYGPNSHDWLFFDSMADRQGGTDGFNIPEVRACPEVGIYLDMPAAELAAQIPRDMKGVAKRLFCDAYMYLYQSSSMCLYY
ncbi:ubiquitin carboxyl-terminal hydrolase CYLD isoform X1 [Hippocampus comes]|uniref:ubiquitin carboxyl-terminal hydrolase CYLD isoform X1 n=1 Tax=Hippocampus comes TaxID=109280 RepID=UPI00094EA9E0|nr:PREDICTED: ubiquitin carboxyl-terminal hydrolase CYLD-like isoform X1 [Hippocampus comes]XP_019727322.1 PREDICTED: ubiquitin carboxyl-terminal hydrolase CYLD-like isoform X1 [Hippocampus comes]XP_019727323.1 PREDICTED: ubiquitin carboxyl-terminal hydrolase CYLD-like isoform X1 [Hippocampus comes]XP_019727324.1 PREDICTED: ubiquitin carboxyl-terminal hydrolase CYLD-like isoform X1 [Hippocampus comes]XP_019727325.1 PREDICTED: ubiquitin carboxyl-terminal hydrolase CYLD-like isoform X1 [Hippocamp